MKHPCNWSHNTNHLLQENSSWETSYSAVNNAPFSLFLILTFLPLYLMEFYFPPFSFPDEANYDSWYMNIFLFQPKLHLIYFFSSYTPALSTTCNFITTWKLKIQPCIFDKFKLALNSLIPRVAWIEFLRI